MNHGIVVPADALGLLFGGKHVEVGRTALVEMVGREYGRHGAGLIDIARNRDEVDDGMGGREAVLRLVYGKAPLHSRAVGLREHAGSFDDLLLGDPGDLGGARRRHFLHAFRQFFEAERPFLHEIMIIEVFLDDDVQHGHCERRVSAGPNAHVNLRAGGQVGKARVDGYQLGAALHAVDDPVPEESIGVGVERIVAPKNENFGSRPFLAVVAVGEPLRAIDRVQVSLYHLRADHARDEAGDAGESVVHEVGATEGEREAVHHADVSPGPPHEHH